MIKQLAPIILGLLSSVACEHQSQPIPAVLTDMREPNLTALKQHLSTAVGRASIKLGASDPSRVPYVSVLPMPLGEHETRSPATPTRFNLMIRGDTCYALQEGNTAMFELYGVACRPL